MAIKRFFLRAIVIVSASLFSSSGSFRVFNVGILEGRPSIEVLRSSRNRTAPEIASVSPGKPTINDAEQRKTPGKPSFEWLSNFERVAVPNPAHTRQHVAAGVLPAACPV